VRKADEEFFWRHNDLMHDPLPRRPFGDTGLEVSAIGLGCWQLAKAGWSTAERDEALAIVHAALDVGCNFFDTAPGYGGGHSEEFLGEVLSPLRRDVVICSKFGHSARGETDFGVSAIRPSVEESLRRLRTDYLDIVLLHNPPLGLLDGRTALQYDELEKLRGEGLIRAYGASLDWRNELDLLRETTASRAAEMLFNVFHQEPLPAFLAARDRGMGLVVKVPLDSGWLTGRYGPDHDFTDMRRRWTPAVRARRAVLLAKFAALVPDGTPLAQAALQFVLAQPSVSTVIPGARSAAQARDNFAAARGRLAPEVVQAIADLWATEIAGDPVPW
jgi:aryl-alcohol dehydrogenase-like predicted oxidoreductase